MTELNIAPGELAERTGLTPPALANLRKGLVRDYSVRLKREVCRVLLWSPDSIDRLLRGEEPISTAPDATVVDAPDTAPVSEPTNADLARKLDGLDDHLGQLIDILGLRRDAERGLRDRTPQSTQRPASVESDET